MRLISLGLIFLGLIILRFTNLLSIPLFGDEALYLWLSSELPSNHNLIFEPFKWGLMPVMIWLEAILLVPLTKIFDPLTSGRVLSVLFDLISAFLVYKISDTLFKNKKISIIASIVYLSLPLNFLHSRLVLFESLTNMFALAGAYFYINYFLLDDSKRKIHFKNIILAFLFSSKSHFQKSSEKRTDNLSIYYFLISSSFLTLAFFTKPIAAVLFLPLLIFPYFFDLSEKKLFLTIKSLRSKQFFNLTKKIIIFFIILCLIIFIFYFPVSTEFQSRFLVEKSSDPNFYTTHFKQNIWRSWWWLQAYLTLPIIFILIGSLTMSLLKKNYLLIWVSLWVGFILFIESLASAHFFPRHLFLLSAPISILVGYFISTLVKQKIFLIIVVVLVLLSSWKTNLEIIIDPQNAPIALEDKQQFFDDWTSGTGLKALAGNLNNLSKDQKIVVFTENSPALFWGLTNLYDTKNVDFVVSENITKGEFVSPEQLNACSRERMYLLLNKNPTPSGDWPVELESSVIKNPNRSINLFKISH